MENKNLSSNEVENIKPENARLRLRASQNIRSGTLRNVCIANGTEITASLTKGSPVIRKKLIKVLFCAIYTQTLNNKKMYGMCFGVLRTLLYLWTFNGCRCCTDSELI